VILSWEQEIKTLRLKIQAEGFLLKIWEKTLYLALFSFFSSSGISVTSASVMRAIVATLAAF
jgi:hypothetical protein